MTRKDYEKIAAAVKRSRYAKEAQSFEAQLAIDVVVNELCAELRSDNYRFDTARFKEACNTKGE